MIHRIPSASKCNGSLSLRDHLCSSTALDNSAVVQLLDRYLTDRQQPEKSIDLIDEASSRLQMEHESKVEVLLDF